MNARIVSSDERDALEAVYQMCAKTIDPQWICSRGPVVPSREGLVTEAVTDELYIAYEGTTIYGMSIVKSDGEMSWLRCDEARWADAARVLIEIVKADKGAAFGIVTNRGLRNLIKTFNSEITDQDNGLIEWR